MQDIFIKDLTIEQFTNVLVEAFQKANKEPLPRYLTRKQAAQFLNVSVSSIDKWTASGKIRRIYIQGSPRFDKMELIEQFNLKNAGIV